MNYAFTVQIINPKADLVEDLEWLNMNVGVETTIVTVFVH